MNAYMDIYIYRERALYVYFGVNIYAQKKGKKLYVKRVTFVSFTLGLFFFYF